MLAAENQHHGSTRRCARSGGVPVTQRDHGQEVATVRADAEHHVSAKRQPDKLLGLDDLGHGG
jgi:hypothetical protein